MISYGEALKLIASLPMMTEIEAVPLNQATGRTLASDLVSRIPSPPHNSSAMDGYALRFDDLSKLGVLKVKGSVFAARAASDQDTSTFNAGECVRINTRGLVPEWADTVVQHESVMLHPDNKISLIGQTKAGENIRWRGEDIEEGAPLLKAGVRISPEISMILAAFGYDRIPVFKLPNIVIGTSGDEVVEPGNPLEKGTVYNSNKHFLLAASRKLGLPIDKELHLPDDFAGAKAALTQVTNSKPLLMITSGAVSAGDRDYMPHLAAELGFEILMHKVAIRPGKPVLLARRGEQIWLGLPGNPLATCCGWYYFARPILASMAGIPAPRKRLITLAQDVNKPKHLRCFYRGTSDGHLVTLHKSQGSAHFLASINSNTYVELPEGSSTIPAKTEVLAITH